MVVVVVADLLGVGECRSIRKGGNNQFDDLRLKELGTPQSIGADEILLVARCTSLRDPTDTSWINWSKLTNYCKDTDTVTRLLQNVYSVVYYELDC